MFTDSAETLAELRAETMAELRAETLAELRAQAAKPLALPAGLDASHESPQ